jgi:hypothetical protein
MSTSGKGLHVNKHLTRHREIDHLVTIDIGGEAASLSKKSGGGAQSSIN